MILFQKSEISKAQKLSPFFTEHVSHISSYNSIVWIPLEEDCGPLFRRWAYLHFHPLINQVATVYCFWGNEGFKISTLKRNWEAVATMDAWRTDSASTRRPERRQLFREKVKELREVYIGLYIREGGEKAFSYLFTPPRCICCVPSRTLVMQRENLFPFPRCICCVPSRTFSHAAHK